MSGVDLAALREAATERIFEDGWQPVGVHPETLLALLARLDAAEAALVAAASKGTAYGWWAEHGDAIALAREARR